METNISQAPEEPITPTEPVAETTPVEAGSPQEQPQTESKLTEADYRRIAREEATRVAQSQTAKSENRINQRITERFAALEANKGVLNLTDEAMATAKKAIIEDEQMKAFSPAQEPQINGQEQPNSDVNIDPGQMMDTLNTRAFQLAGGTVVTPQDKEWAVMDKAWKDPQGNPDMYIIAAVDASRAKAQRLEAQKKNAAARVTSTGTEITTGTPTANSSDDYWKKAHKK